MPDDKMRNDDLNRQAGSKGSDDRDIGRKSPGRNPADDKSTGHRTGNEPKHDQSSGGGQEGQRKGDMGQQR